MALIRRCAALRPGAVIDPTTAAKHTLRAIARRCGVAPIPASPGMTTRHRLNRGGHRQAGSALYRAVTVRLAPPTHPGLLPTQDGRGPTKAEIIRCLKRLLAREIWSHLR